MKRLEDLHAGSLLSPAAVAAILGIQPHQLAVWRAQKIGIPWVKIGENRTGAVRYLATDVQAFIIARRLQVKRLAYLGPGKPTRRIRKAASVPAGRDAPVEPRKP